ncbi:MAG: TRAP transporter substrate-binding protein [Gemmiger sp.]
MKRMLCLLAALAMLALAGCAAQSGQTDSPELILRYADNQPEDYPTTRAAHYFAELVEERTQGKIRVRVYANGELGDEVSVVEQVQFGGIDFARASLSTLTSACPSLTVLQMPCLYNDADQMWRVLDGEIGEEFLAATRSGGIVGLSWFDAGTRSFYTCEAVTTLEDLEGLRIRVQENEMMSDMVRSLGAIPVQIPYNDVYSAIMTGKVDGAENNWSSYASTGHYEGAPYVYLDEHSRVPEMQLMSTVAMDKVLALDEDYYAILCQCARESALYERALWAESEQAAQAEMLEKGCVITIPSAADQAEIRARMEPFYELLSSEERALVERIRAS